jgi:flagellar basal-body rod protein FlgC
MVTGVQLGSLRMAISANDVANVNTPGFKQSDLIQVERSPGTAVGAIQRTESPSPAFSGTDLAREFGAEMPVAQASYTANLKVVKVADEMIGSLLDLRG